jgi:IrrE N-terminal-like domain
VSSSIEDRSKPRTSFTRILKPGDRCSPSSSKQIAVRPDVAPAQAIKTLIHELGHALLHAEGPVASREAAEVEVESVAFIVCDALGLDSGEYRFPYVTRWAEGSNELVRQTAERAIGCAKAILEGLEESEARALATIGKE